MKDPMTATYTQEAGETEPEVDKVYADAVEDDAFMANTMAALPDNLALNEALVKKFQHEAHEDLLRFKAQNAREELEEMMQTADNMLRAAKARNVSVKGEDQPQKTLSNVTCTDFYRSHRILVAGQRAVIFYGDELPAKYEPCAKSPDYSDGEAARIAQGRNLVLRYNWDKDGWDKKIKQSLYFLAKYGHEVYSCDWDYRVARRVERVPGYYDKQGEPVELRYDEDAPTDMFDAAGDPLKAVYAEGGRPQSFVFVEKDRVISDWVRYQRHDLKNIWFDMTIPDMQDQLCVIERFQKPLEWWHQNPHFVNVEKIGKNQEYAGEGDSDVAKERADNEERSLDDEGNGLIDGYRVWMRVPIDESKGGKSPKSKGKWESKMVPTWHEAVFAGDFQNDGETVCVLLRKNPYHHRRLPYNYLYSIEDDRGALHMCYASLCECLYEEIKTTIDQLIDNKTLRNRKPFVGEKGNVLSRDLTFRNGNQVMWVKPGSGKTALTEINIEDTTQSALQHLGYFEDAFNKAMGTDKAFAGEFAGSRTTGTEYMGVRDQAMKPALEDAEMIADQLFPRLLTDLADLWDQFADPDKTLYITDGADLKPVVPAELYGENEVRVVSIGQFESDLTLRQTVVNLLSGSYEKFAGLMGPDGQVDFWKYVFRLFNIKDADKFFKGGGGYDAQKLALIDARRIIQNPAMAMQSGLPEEAENHVVQVPVLEGMKNRYQYGVAPDQQDPMVLQAFDLYISMHKQFQQQQAAGQQAAMGAMGGQPQQAAGPENQSAMPPAMGGEAGGDMLAGVASQGNGEAMV